ncbi:hypothetical protein VA7868_04230 [Vibrio aerogenes CECT 7868]|uniref:Uncharacterized protein n=1 Tax=Vibrio aerogenes CECT 7868 TaxID=1216006 RepID=A0A1M6DHQ2_9VIBR|nr:hypothetical protein [Vibrio aerogenes]SHI72538.1 hypothetical protein VA7868_04230 [Vibrio aerogenes CECT 7868]
MKHVMPDIDGTLIQSYEFDEKYSLDAGCETTGIELMNDWEMCPNVTDRRILQTFIHPERVYLS